MAGSSLMDKPPSGLLLFLFRVPLVFYKLGLGGLLGQRFLQLEHVGRKSGQVHRTVVEVVGHDKETDAYFIASGWGYKAQWYQNLQAHPDINIQVGWRKLHVHAETLSPEEGARQLLDYQRRHPVAAKELGPMMGIDLAAGDAATLEAVVRERLPILSLTP